MKTTKPFDISAFYKVWPVKIALSALIVLISIPIALLFEGWVIQPTAVVILMCFGFIGLALGFEKHKFWWKKYVVGFASLIMYLVAANLVDLSLHGAWWHLPLLIALTSFYPAFDEVVEEEWKIFPDKWTALLACNLLGITLWLLR